MIGEMQNPSTLHKEPQATKECQEQEKPSPRGRAYKLVIQGQIKLEYLSS